MSQPFSAAGRSVVVTGGSRGIGLGIASVFARSGARVVITGRDEASLERAAARLTAEGPGVVVPVVADAADRAACDRMAAVAVQRHGGIDVLCANAGIYPEVPISEMTEDDLAHMMAVNLNGTVFAAQACLDALTESGSGRVVIVSSITGPITGMVGSAHYGASKAAQLGFMRSAALEWAPRRITVNAVLPGNIATEGLAELGDDYRTSMEAAIPMGALGDVRDIGHSCLFLASREAGFITGQTLVVDGGQVLPESRETMRQTLQIKEGMP